MQQPDPQKRSTPKPSLLTASDQGDPGNVRILASLPQGGSPPVAAKPARRRFGLLAFVFGLVAVAVAVTLTSGPDNTLAALAPETAIQQSVPAAVATSIDAGTQSQKSASPTVIGKSESSPAPNAALIVTEEVPATMEIAGTKTSGQDKLTTVLEADIKPPPAALKTALEASSAAPETKPIAHARPINRVASTKHVDRVATPSAQSARSDSQADRDINLLTALVAHSSERDAKQTAKEAALVRSQKLARNNTGIVKTNVKPADRNQDVVERQASDSTESLLERCKSLGFIEGQLCRWRICSGRWDTDAACKVK